MINFTIIFRYDKFTITIYEFFNKFTIIKNIYTGDTYTLLGLARSLCC